jgi:hypothetical protein
LVDPDSQLPSDHRARRVWSFVAGLELSAFYVRIEAHDDTAGRPASDPAVGRVRMASEGRPCDVSA